MSAGGMCSGGSHVLCFAAHPSHLIRYFRLPSITRTAITSSTSYRSSPAGPPSPAEPSSPSSPDSSSELLDASLCLPLPGAPAPAPCWRPPLAPQPPWSRPLPPRPRPLPAPQPRASPRPPATAALPPTSAPLLASSSKSLRNCCLARRAFSFDIQLLICVLFSLFSRANGPSRWQNLDLNSASAACSVSRSGRSKISVSSAFCSAENTLRTTGGRIAQPFGSSEGCERIAISETLTRALAPRCNRRTQHGHLRAARLEPNVCGLRPRHAACLKSLQPVRL
mmetsp:Transcript_32883/g.96805  ORF Transcript_32883/g.96805 Transcript_32883/m.96805 type:complete len:281 (-) Transcript_32883:395-1237(-)